MATIRILMKVWMAVIRSSKSPPAWMIRSPESGMFSLISWSIAAWAWLTATPSFQLAVTLMRKVWSSR